MKIFLNSSLFKELLEYSLFRVCFTWFCLCVFYICGIYRKILRLFNFIFLPGLCIFYSNADLSHLHIKLFIPVAVAVAVALPIAVCFYMGLSFAYFLVRRPRHPFTLFFRPIIYEYQFSTDKTVKCYIGRTAYEGLIQLQNDL
jgi:hypothetical protein